jgi:hypothetical protein
MSVTKAAWTQLKFNIRSMIATELLQIAMKVAPGAEKASLTLAVHWHFMRCLKGGK